MWLREDWLANVLTVPYVPTLGPVHPDEHPAGQFSDVIRASGTGRFLPHDGAARWSTRQDEVVLAEQIVHEPDLTVIPTLHRRRSLLKVHHYGPGQPDPDVSAKICAEAGASSGRLMWFGRSAGRDGTRLMLKTLDRSRQPPCAQVRSLTALPAAERATFVPFAHALADEGFAFLHHRMSSRQVTGPILVTVQDDRIVGAIGPMRALPNSAGVLRLLPQYLGVLPASRGRGLGRSLWRAACQWGRDHGANYQILQARCGGPSERLFLSEGLRTLGFIHTAAL